MAGGRVRLTLITPTDELVLPPLSVAEAFALGHAERHPLSALLRAAGAEHVRARVRKIDPAARSVELEDGESIGYEALILCPGARAVEGVSGATTWWPSGGRDGFLGMLRDLEEGYTKRVAFALPGGAVWPLPLYELALMTARQASDMDIDDAELSVITPEAIPLALFGPQASAVLHDELQAAGIRLYSGTVARVEDGHPTSIVLQPTPTRIEVDRVIAVPALEGPSLPGTTYDDAGFIKVGRGWQMQGVDDVWAAGDAVAYPLKFGGIAAQQADVIASEIARRAGADVPARPERPSLQGVLMTGDRPHELTAATPVQRARPLWRPTTKVFGEYLTPFLAKQRDVPSASEALSGVRTESVLPAPAG
jgi:sulfide:quinone oxidoreductase